MTMTKAWTPLRRSSCPVSIRLPGSVCELAERYARNAMVGGRSHVRASGDRMARLHEDQLTGQLCHAAASVYLFGSFDPWRRHRDEADAEPMKGDGGTDFPGWPIDIKGSRMRGSCDPSDYHLIVRPAELCRSTWYVHSLVSCDRMDTVHLCGIASGGRVASVPVAESGPLAGAHVIGVPELSAIELLWETRRDR